MKFCAVPSESDYTHLEPKSGCEIIKTFKEDESCFSTLSKPRKSEAAIVGARTRNRNQKVGQPHIQ